MVRQRSKSKYARCPVAATRSRATDSSWVTAVARKTSGPSGWRHVPRYRAPCSLAKAKALLTAAGVGSVTPWGKPTKGYKTRDPKKASNRLIIRRRKSK